MHLRLMSLLSFALLCCVAAPLLADANDNAVKIKIDPMPAGWTGHDMEGTFMAFDEDADMVQLNWSTNQTDFKRWCGIIKEREDGAGGGWSEYKSADLQAATAGPSGTMQYDFTGKRADDAMHGRVYLLQVGKVFCWMKCFSSEAAWGKNKGAFDEMVKGVK